MTTELTPSPNLRALLGLGLKFIPTPLFPTRWSAISKTPKMSLCRLRRQIHLRSFFVNQDPLDPNSPDFNPKLHTESDWEPPTDFPPDLQDRLHHFEAALRPLYPKRCSKFNLLPTQRYALSQARLQKGLLVVACDKNLGPAVIERSRYIKMALHEHLLDETTYTPLTSEETTRFCTKIRRKFDSWLHRYTQFLSKQERTFLRRWADDCKEVTPYFYLLMKVHKPTLSSRPIVSCSGSLLYALGVWVDLKLQRIAAQQHTFLKSSFDLKNELLDLHLPPTARFFTSDAVGMYTNIRTTAALQEIGSYLRRNAAQFADIPIQALMDALSIIMKNNVVRFGDTAWHQIKGCAMGTPPAPPYATLFYAIWEETLLSEFGANLFLLRRYIDDMLGIWVVINPDTDADTWARFQSRLNDYHGLEWETSPRSLQVDFLDLTLSMADHRITTTLYSKPLNLYLYIPPRSAHPPGVLTGLVFGTIHRIFTLCSSPQDIRNRLQDFWNRLQARGYEHSDIYTIFTNGISHAKNHLDSATLRPDPTDTQPSFFMHVRYHPQDPPSQAIQEAWKTRVSEPSLRPALADLPVYSVISKRQHRFAMDRLIVCYHRPPNLGNLLSYRKIRPDAGPLVSSYLPDD